MGKQSTLLDVLSGNESIKAEASVSTNTIITLCISVLVLIVLSTVFIKEFKGFNQD